MESRRRLLAWLDRYHLGSMACYMGAGCFYLHGYNGACISGTKLYSVLGTKFVCERKLTPACLLFTSMQVRW